MKGSVQATDRFDRVAYDQIVASTREPALADRDVELLLLISEGFTYREIAEHFSSSSNAVRTRVRGLRRRFRVRTTADLLMTAYEQGLVTDQVAERVVALVARLVAELGRKEEECQGVLASIGEPWRPTSRQLELIELICEGLSNQEIAGRLSVSVKTVPNRIHRLRLCLGASARTDIVAVARQRGLVSC
jgi:DNA-binding NarL/FixJ family response regulator